MTTWTAFQFILFSIQAFNLILHELLLNLCRATSIKADGEKNVSRKCTVTVRGESTSSAEGPGDLQTRQPPALFFTTKPIAASQTAEVAAPRKFKGISNVN